MRMGCFCVIIAVFITPSWGMAKNHDLTLTKGFSLTGAPLDLGKFRMPWSRANSQFGYLYGVEGVSFAGVTPGPSSWNCRGYQSYLGVNPDSATFNPQNVLFSKHEMLVFKTSEGETTNTGASPGLLFNYHGEMGMVAFTQINDLGVYYQYGWINLEETTPENERTAGSTSDGFATQGVYFIDPSTEYETVTVTNGDTVVVNSSARINGAMEILDGNLIVDPGITLSVNDIEISEASTLFLGNDSRLIVTGNWTNNGLVLPEKGAVVFNGDTPQKISGATRFYSLEIDTAAWVKADKLEVEYLSIDSGLLVLATDSRLHNVFIDTPGVLSPEEEAVIVITGDLYNGGSFIHNEGTVIFDGQVHQEIYTNSNSFFNLGISGNDVHFLEPPLIENSLF